MFMYFAAIILLFAFPLWVFAEFEENKKKRIIWGLICMSLFGYGAWSGAELVTTIEYNILHRGGTIKLIDKSIKMLEEGQDKLLCERLKTFKQTYHQDYLTPARYLSDIVDGAFENNK